MELSLYGSVSFRNPMGLFHTMRIASELGYQAIDVRGQSLDTVKVMPKNINAVGYDMLGPGFLDEQGMKDLKKELRLRKLHISAISCYNPLLLPEGELASIAYDKFKKMVDFCEVLEIPFVRLIGYSEKPYEGITLERNTAKRLLAERIKALCQYSAPKGIGVLLENGEGCIPKDAQEQLDLSDRVDEPNLKIVCDVLNYAFEGLDPMKEVKCLLGHIGCLHVKNACMNGGYRGFKWTVLSKGDVDYQKILQQVFASGFDGTIVCEYANPFKGMGRDYWNDMPDPKSWAKDARDFITSMKP